MNWKASIISPTARCPRCEGSPGSVAGGLCPTCALSVAFAEPLARFAGYEILEELGRGGMGQVYLAHHAASGRIVALKTPTHGGIPSPEILRRFHSEAEAVAALDHPGIVPIYEVSEWETLPYFTMKFAEGGSLAERLDEYRGDFRRAAELIACVAEAVHHAHVRGILHRDLKPQNILLDEHGRAYVSDFGVSRWLGRDTDHTHTGSFVGSPNYMAPEQTSLSPGDLTVAADIFSLGAILYHLLSGKPPFQADSVAATLRRLGEGDLQRLPSSIPRDLESICVHSLELDPSARYPSAQAFAADLRAWLDGRPIGIRRVSPVELLWRFAKRNPVLAALSTITLLAVIGGSLATLLVHRRALVAETARADAAEALANDRWRMNLISEARALRLSGLPGQRTMALAKLRQAWSIAPSIAIRNEAIAALTLPDLGAPTVGKLPAQSKRSNDLLETLSPDKKTVTVRSRNGEVVEILPLSRLVTSRAWSPSHDQLILGTSDKHLSVWNRATRQLTRRLSGRESVSTQLCVSHHSNFVADITAEGALRIWRLSSGEDLITAHFDASPDFPPQWSEDDSMIFFKSRESTDWRCVNVILPSVNRLLELAEPEPAFEDSRTIDLDPTATRAAVTTESRIRIWDLSTGLILGSWKKNGDEWALARFLPGGKSLLIGGWSSDVQIASAAAPAEAHIVQRMPGAFLATLSPSGAVAGFVDNTDHEFEFLNAPFAGPSIHLPQKKPFDLAVSPDAQWIAASSYGVRGVRIFSWPGLKMAASLDVGTAAHIAIDPHGDHLYLATDSVGSQWRVKGWIQERQVGLDEIQHSAMYSPDGKLLAIETRQSIRLHDPATGLEVARLPTSGNPRGRSSASFTFSLDGQILAVQTINGGILLWNLPILHSQLEKMGMDWN